MLAKHHFNREPAILSDHYRERERPVLRANLIYTYRLNFHHLRRRRCLFYDAKACNQSLRLRCAKFDCKTYKRAPAPPPPLFRHQSHGTFPSHFIIMMLSNDTHKHTLSHNTFILCVCSGFRLIIICILMGIENWIITTTSTAPIDVAAALNIKWIYRKTWSFSVCNSLLIFFEIALAHTERRRRGETWWD